jgi:hypothetical protein
MFFNRPPPPKEIARLNEQMPLYKILQLLALKHNALPPMKAAHDADMARLQAERDHLWSIRPVAGIIFDRGDDELER